MGEQRNPVDKLNIADLKWTQKHVGNLTQDMVDILNNHREISLNPAEIHIGRDRVKYVEKHKSEFTTEESYIKSIESVPDIISKPDYIGLHPAGDGIEFIKRLDEDVLIAVRIRTSGVLWVRSVYPLTETRLEGFKKSGRCIEFSKNP